MRSVRRPPSIANSAPSLRTLTTPPGCAVPVTGAGPHALLHCWTVNTSFTAVMFHAPSIGGSAPSALAGRASVAAKATVQTMTRKVPGSRRFTHRETSRGDLASAKLAGVARGAPPRRMRAGEG